MRSKGLYTRVVSILVLVVLALFLTSCTGCDSDMDGTLNLAYRWITSPNL